jgi:phospholipid-binding lipoprotein MlaA
MKPQRIKHPKWFTLFILLSLSVWGCTHGNKTAPVVSEPADRAHAVDGVADGEQAPAQVDDPLFDSIPNDTVQPSGVQDTVDPFVSVDDPLFDSIPEGTPQNVSSAGAMGPSAAATDDPLFDEDPLFNDTGNTHTSDNKPVDLTPDSLVWDPLMPVNRFMFSFNDKMYFWFLKPMAKGYKAVTPQFFRTGLRNAFRNIAMPIRFVSCVLQLKVKRAGEELGRFLVNTTVGIGGLWDPADTWLGLPHQKEDVGQALGSYGIGNGFYVVLPFLGPSTVRDSVGMVGDMFLHPLYYVDDRELAIGLSALDLFNRTSFIIGDYEALKAASMDPYVMSRDFYINYRNKLIAE